MPAGPRLGDQLGGGLEIAGAFHADAGKALGELALDPVDLGLHRRPDHDLAFGPGLFVERLDGRAVLPALLRGRPGAAPSPRTAASQRRGQQATRHDGFLPECSRAFSSARFLYSAAIAQGAGRIDRGTHLVRIGFEPADRRRRDEVAAARAVIDLGMVDARRRDPFGRRRAPADDAPPRAADHQVADGEMLERCGRRSSPCSRSSPGPAGGCRRCRNSCRCAAGRGRSCSRSTPLAASRQRPNQPVSFGTRLPAHAGAGDLAAVLHLAQARRVLLPRDVDEHGVVVVHRHPGAGDDVIAKQAVGRHRPERKQEVREAPVDPALPRPAGRRRTSCPNRCRRRGTRARG